MEGLNKSSENSAVNFPEISRRRKELRKAISDLGVEVSGDVHDRLYGELYEKPLAEVNEQAGKFSEEVEKDAGGLGENITGLGKLEGGKRLLKKQRTEHEVAVLRERAHIDYEKITKETPEIGSVRSVVKNITGLKNFRMKRMLESLKGGTSESARLRNDAVLRALKKEIDDEEEKLEKIDPLVLRQAELIGYKEDLSQAGHICITPSVERDFEAIGDRMLTGKPMLLHGPTGTGKTSLARFAAMSFTGKDPEMVYCSPQTKESNIWGKTGIKPTKGGAIETVEIYGPLAKAMTEGKTVIFDEFTALPKEQMVFIKGVLNAKPGDRINIVGNGIVEIVAGFQITLTANLKSEKNPERQDLPPEIAREFEQNNLEVKYSPPDEAFDIAISRLLNRDGSLDMSYYDLNTTLPNLCNVMAEIQESYTNETNRDVARSAGAMDASGGVYSLKKFVMTQGSVEAILSSWLIERQMGRKERSFAEFLDERFKTALTFKEYSKEDRILVAKILASKGFLRTLTAKDLDVPDDVFTFDAIRALRGDEAIEELQRESGDVKHLTLKEVAMLDPFKKRSEILRGKAEALLGGETGEEVGDDFSRALRKKLAGLSNGAETIKTSKISAEYTHPGGRIETITIDIEAKLQEFISFYQRTGVDLPRDFDNFIRVVWKGYQKEIKEAIEQNGFDEVLIIPGNIPLPELAEKMKMGSGYIESINFTAGGSFAGAISQNADKSRIILVHKTQNLNDRPELASTFNTRGQDVKIDQVLSLEDYLVFQRKFFEETNKRLDEVGSTLLGTKSGPRLVSLNDFVGQVAVDARDLTSSMSLIGARPARCFP